MMANYAAGEGESFIIPARTLRGSKREMVEDIDQAIVGLLALRHLIDDGAPPPEAPEFDGHQRPRLHKTSWPRLRSALGRIRVSFGRLQVNTSRQRDQWSSPEVS